VFVCICITESAHICFAVMQENDEPSVIPDSLDSGDARSSPPLFDSSSSDNVCVCVVWYMWVHVFYVHYINSVTLILCLSLVVNLVSKLCGTHCKYAWEF